ncbi:hypothetical protein JL721_11137 [Aureococcus anophagefferens]|nr:hypothetical protein JL721_11137 [Aureococcus anophagefferens]
MAALAEPPSSAPLKERLNGKWVVSSQEGLDAFYRDARKMGWLQRKVLCVTTGVSVEFAFGADETCTFTMSFAVKSGTADYVLGEPVVVEEGRGRGGGAAARRRVRRLLKSFGPDDVVDDVFTLDGEDRLVCHKTHSSGATAARTFARPRVVLNAPYAPVDLKARRTRTGCRSRATAPRGSSGTT